MTDTKSQYDTEHGQRFGTWQSGGDALVRAKVEQQREIAVETGATFRGLLDSIIGAGR